METLDGRGVVGGFIAVSPEQADDQKMIWGKEFHAGWTLRRECPWQTATLSAIEELPHRAVSCSRHRLFGWYANLSLFERIERQVSWTAGGGGPVFLNTTKELNYGLWLLFTYQAKNIISLFSIICWESVLGRQDLQYQIERKFPPCRTLRYPWGSIVLFFRYYTGNSKEQRSPIHSAR